MKKYIFSLLVLTVMMLSCKQDQGHHPEPSHNFTVKRLLILNDKNELLMTKVDDNWYTPSLVYDQRQYLRECLDSLAGEYGIKISQPKLGGYFSYKYEYHPYATMRAYYVAKYLRGSLKVPAEMQEVKWIPIEQAIELTPVEAMKEITAQILKFPDRLWGASFLVYRDGEDHHTRLVEPFYPLFN